MIGRMNLSNPARWVLRFVQVCADAAARTQDVGYKHQCLSVGFSKHATACCTHTEKTFPFPAFYLSPLL